MFSIAGWQRYVNAFFLQLVANELESVRNPKA